MCLYSRLIKNAKYKPNKKNGGIIPSIPDPRVLYVPIGCGNCIECRNQEARKWQIRLFEDIKHNTNGKFVTLTFSNESISKILYENKELQKLTGYNLDNAIATKAVHLFRERHRKAYGKSIRHWLITELGHNGTENIHLHGILWTNLPRQEITTLWNYGYIWPRYDKDWQKNYVSTQTINYLTKYVTKIDADHKYYKPRVLTSPGIGSAYTNTPQFKRNIFQHEKTIETYKTATGHEIALPIYYRNKAYTDQEKELLWLQKLDKNERWVCGEKIPADNTEEYFKLLEWHRNRNNKLGYGKLEIDWERKIYEETRRKLLYETRLKNQRNV